MNAILYKRPNGKFIKEGPVPDIAKAYLAFSRTLRKSYYVEFEGEKYSGEYVEKLLERVTE